MFILVLIFVLVLKFYVFLLVVPVKKVAKCFVFVVLVLGHLDVEAKVVEVPGCADDNGIAHAREGDLECEAGQPFDALKEEVSLSHVCCHSDSKVKPDSSVSCSYLDMAKLYETDEMSKLSEQEIDKFVVAGDTVVSKQQPEQSKEVGVVKKVESIKVCKVVTVKVAEECIKTAEKVEVSVLLSDDETNRCLIVDKPCLSPDQRQQYQCMLAYTDKLQVDVSRKCPLVVCIMPNQVCCKRLQVCDAECVYVKVEKEVTTVEVNQSKDLIVRGEILCWPNEPTDCRKWVGCAGCSDDDVSRVQPCKVVDEPPNVCQVDCDQTSILEKENSVKKEESSKKVEVSAFAVDEVVVKKVCQVSGVT